MAIAPTPTRFLFSGNSLKHSYICECYFLLHLSTNGHIYDYVKRLGKAYQTNTNETFGSEMKIFDLDTKT